MIFKCYRFFAKILTAFLPLNSTLPSRIFFLMISLQYEIHNTLHLPMRLLILKGKKFTRHLMCILTKVAVNSSSLGNGLT